MKKSRNSGNKGGDDRNLWNHVTRSVKSYSRAGTPTPKKSAPKTALPKKAVPDVVPSRHVAPAAPSLPKGFDRATETKLRRGQLALEGRLDLHGMTQREAFEALHRFIYSAVAQKKRTVLLITGKGLRSEGVLRRMLPLWLEDPELNKHLIALTPAQPKDGGSGAFYLRLRKQR